MPFDGDADDLDAGSVATCPQPATPRNKRRVQRKKLLSEEEVLDRIEDLQRAVEFPAPIWNLMVDLLCPETTAVPPMPEKATDTLPGTEARLQVLQARQARGQQLFHPGDRRWEDGDSDRMEIAGIRLRNGAADRFGRPLVERRHDGHHGVSAAGEEKPPETLWAGVVTDDHLRELAKVIHRKLRLDQCHTLASMLQRRLKM